MECEATSETPSSRGSVGLYILKASIIFKYVVRVGGEERSIDVGAMSEDANDDNKYVSCRRR